MCNSAGHAGCRSGEGDATKLSTLASELVRPRVDILVARLTPAVLAASRAKQTIPIVMAGAGDPIGNRIVDSLARPGRSITGAGISGQLSGKLVELARDVTPSTREIAVLAETTFQRLSITATRLRSVTVQPSLPRAAAGGLRVAGKKRGRHAADAGVQKTITIRLFRRPEPGEPPAHCAPGVEPP